MKPQHDPFAGAHSLEPLDQRTLLAHVGLDLSFGNVGRGEVDATLLVSSLAGGKVLAVGKKLATRLNADGSLDQTFFDAGGAQAALGKMDWSPATRWSADSACTSPASSARARLPPSSPTTSSLSAR